MYEELLQQQNAQSDPDHQSKLLSTASQQAFFARLSGSSKNKLSELTEEE